jgi:anaerobic ribonucleoside-triphosphate reductase activating protein
MSTSAKDIAIRLHRFLPVTEAEGPGRRAAIWVQGCPIHCLGCFNRQTWNPRGGYTRTIDDLFREIASQPRLEGVTFTGGEPFAQAAALAKLGCLCKQVGLSVVTYTGYKYDHIRRSGCHTWKDLLGVTDLLLAGPFVKKLADSSRLWVGSSNQEFIFLSARYQHLQKQIWLGRKELETWIEPEGICLNGTAPESDINSIQRETAKLGLRLKK